jgi:hypothetical protein
LPGTGSGLGEDGFQVVAGGVLGHHHLLGDLAGVEASQSSERTSDSRRVSPQTRAYISRRSAAVLGSIATAMSVCSRDALTVTQRLPAKVYPSPRTALKRELRRQHDRRHVHKQRLGLGHSNSP